MPYTLWQSSPLAKKPYKKTLEKLEVLGLWWLYFLGGVGWG